MDPLTHVLLGGSLGYVAFRKTLGRTAAWVGGLAAFIPDADVFIRSKSDPLLAVEYHRHFTHALMFAPVGAAIVAGVAMVSPANRSRFLLLWFCATIAYLSHSFLDGATSYGTQLLWPFSNRRFGWDFVSVIDPAVTLVLAVGLTWALVRQHSRPAMIGLCLAFVYLGAGVAQHARGVSAQSKLAEARGHVVERLEVMPTMANNLVWRSLYVHDGAVYSDRVRVGWFSSAMVREGSSLPLVQRENLTAEETARNAHRSYERFNWFSDGWVCRSPVDSSVLGDMRYSLSAEAFDPIWGIRFTSPGSRTEVAWINRSRDRKIDPGELWREIIGRDARFKSLDQLR